jgi:hypothetical protein
LSRRIDAEKKIANTRSEELKKNYRTTQRQRRADMKRLETDAGMTFAELQRNAQQSKAIKLKPQFTAASRTPPWLPSG